MARARGWAAGAVLIGIVAVSLGCAGLWREAVASGFNVMTVDLEQAVPASDPNFEAVQALIDEGFVAAWEGHVGLLGAVPFSATMDDALADGALSEGEVLLLTEHAAVFREHPIDEERRRSLLLIKAVKDDEERRSRGVSAGGPGGGVGAAPPTGADPGAWALPDDLRSGLEAAGWEVEACTVRGEPGVVWARCSAAREDRLATALVEQYDDEAEAAAAETARAGTARIGAATVTIRVLDGGASEALRDALTAGRSGVGGLGEKELRRGLETAGWKVSGCEDRTEAVDRSTSCRAAREGQEAEVELIRVDGSTGIPRRSVQAGAATVTVGANLLSVQVERLAEAQALLDALLGG